MSTLLFPFLFFIIIIFFIGYFNGLIMAGTIQTIWWGIILLLTILFNYMLRVKIIVSKANEIMNVK